MKQLLRSFATALVIGAAALPSSAGEYRLERGRDSFGDIPGRLQPGDTLVLAPGQVYRETLVLTRSGTPARPITIRGNGAVISGLRPIGDDTWVDRGGGLFFSPNGRSWGAHDPQAYDAAGRLRRTRPGGRRQCAGARGGLLLPERGEERENGRQGGVFAVAHHRDGLEMSGAV